MLALLTRSKDAPRLVAEAWLSVNIEKRYEAKEKEGTHNSFIAAWRGLNHGSL